MTYHTLVSTSEDKQKIEFEASEKSEGKDHSLDVVNPFAVLPEQPVGSFDVQGSYLSLHRPQSHGLG